MSSSCSGAPAWPSRPKLPIHIGNSRSNLSSVPTTGCEHGFNPTARPAELADGALDFRFLVMQAADLFLELSERDAQLRHLPVAQIVKIEHLPDFLEREADRLAHQHIPQPGAVAATVEPVLSVPAGRDQGLLLIEAKGPGADAEFLGQLADCEDFLPGRARVEAVRKARNGGPGIPRGSAFGMDFRLHDAISPAMLGPARCRTGQAYS